MGADSIRDAGLHTSPRGMSFSSSSSSLVVAPQRRGRHTSTSSQTPSLVGFLFSPAEGDCRRAGNLHPTLAPAPRSRMSESGRCLFPGLKGIGD